jgi:hypothetical protein
MASCEELITYDQRGGEHRFFLFADNRGFVELHEVIFFVSSTDTWPPPDGHYYELAIRKFNESTVQTTQMENHDHAELRGKGITEALIPEISRRLQRDVLSSPEYRDNSDRRTVHATKVWERLVSRGVAVREGDRYRVNYSTARQQAMRRTSDDTPGLR